MRKKRAMNSRDFLKYAGIGGVMAFSGMPKISWGQKPKEAVLGIVLPMTGPGGTWGQNIWPLLEIIRDEINEAGGIKSLGGAKIRLVLLDSQTKPEVASRQTEKLIDMQVAMILGSGHSASTIVSSQLCEKNEYPNFCPGSLADEITDRGFKWNGALAPKMSWAGRDAVKFALDMGKKTGYMPKKAGILVEDSPFGMRGGEAAKKTAQEAGLEIVDFVSYPAQSTTDFRSFISKFKAAKLEVMFQANYAPDGVMITRQYKELDFNPYGFIGMSGGHYTPEYLDMLKADANYTCCAVSANPDTPIPGSKELQAKYIKKVGKPFDSTAGQWATGLAVAVNVLERTGTVTDRKAIRDAFRTTELKAGEKYVMIVDGVKIDPETGRNMWAQNVMMEILNQDRRTVWPEKYKTVNPVWPMPKWSERK